MLIPARLYLSLLGFEPDVYVRKELWTQACTWRVSITRVSDKQNGFYLFRRYLIRLLLELSYSLVSFFKNGPMQASFCLFSSFSHYNFNNTNWKKRRWCAWDLNPRPQMVVADDTTTELRRPLPGYVEFKLQINKPSSHRIIVEVMVWQWWWCWWSSG